MAKRVGVVIVFGAIASAISAGKEIAIAWRFGVSEVVDAYQFTFAVAQWPLSIIASVYFAALVPRAMAVQAKSRLQAQHFRAETLGLTSLLLVPLTLLVYAGLHFVVGRAFADGPATTLALATSMTLPMALMFGAGLVAAICAGWIMADGRHTNTLLQAIPAAVVMLAIVLFDLGVVGLLVSTAGGFLLYALVSLLCLPNTSTKSATGARLRYLPRSRNTQLLLAGMGTLLFGQFLLSFVTIIDQWFAAQLGPGTLSMLGYSTRIVGLVLSLFAIAISRGLMPGFAKIQVENPLALRAAVLRYGLIVLLVGLVLAAMGIAASDLLVKLLFQRGEFTAEDTVKVGSLVRYAMVQVPFYFSSMVVVSALLVQGRYRAVTIAAAINGVVKLLLAYLLVARYGLPGLLLATALVYLLSTIVCTVQLFRPGGTSTHQNSKPNQTVQNP